MKKQTITTKLFSILCENQRGILSRFTGIFERFDFSIHCVTQSLTDTHGIVLIMLEIEMPGMKVDNCLNKIRKVIGVLEAMVSFGDFPRVGYFCFETAKANSVINYGTLISCTSTHIIMEKQGSLEDLRRFYNKFDKPGLIGFTQHPLPINESALFQYPLDNGAEVLHKILNDDIIVK